ncbi:hypothetical protein SAMN06295974_0356 [Plantibacter flavus]|uniref:Uncharacterized protein n=1 Tax=Plantibacter flavus TaxID=150123 RepID=A0A3N2C0W2_9MICO|nr:hypothetical protein EDD42_1183 [Plantibacter flavus]SMG08151.1 hypothetical protein SAMN06295974_0356 [Plantibacter flavus]
MLLAEAYISHRGPLLAAIQSAYGLRLRDRPLMEMSDLVADLPPGCSLWRAIGGPLAWSAETHMLSLVEYQMRRLAWMQSEDAQKKPPRNAPKPPETPPYAGEVAVQDAHAQRQRAARQRRQQPTQ